MQKNCGERLKSQVNVYCWHESAYVKDFTGVERSFPSLHGNGKVFPMSGLGEWQGRSLIPVWMLTVGAESISYSFFHSDDWNMRLLPYRDSLMTLSDPPPSSVSKKYTAFLSCWHISIQEHSPPNPSFSAYVSIVSSFPLPPLVNPKAFQVKQ